MHKILVIDDEVMVRKLLAEALTRAGYKSVTVPTGEEAFAALEREAFDLAIVDVRLSSGSGLDVVKKIRGAGSKLPVIVYSGVLTAAIETDARSAGADEVLNKSIGIFPLLEQIRRFLSASARRSNDTVRRAARPILVVDDDPAVRKMLRTFLASKGYDALEAESGEKAVEIVGRGANPAAVLLDMQMPGGIDGLETLKRLRELDPAIGVVVATGANADAAVKKALELGAYGYVLKPFDFLYLELVVLSRLLISES